MAPFSSHLEFQLLASPFNDSSTPIPRSARSESSHSHSSPSNTNTNTPFNTPSNTTSHTASGRTHTGMHVDSHLRLRESHAAMVARKLLRQRAVQARDEDVIYETAMPPLLLPVVPMRGGSGSSKSGSTKSGNVDAGDVEAGEAVDYENAPSTSNSNSSLHSESTAFNSDSNLDMNLETHLHLSAYAARYLSGLVPYPSLPSVGSVAGSSASYARLFGIV
ncbi:hypothetical protein BDW22DRAFT_1362046 [Trametopsis cervina]|nr:hypothetical protein BDW22DRAFT_1362046 [Trametopsis cervina]